jgi:cholesterol transport system auxiliary component
VKINSLALPALAALAGCALLGKNDPVVSRQFTPDYPSEAHNAAKAGPLQALRLGRIEGWSHLRERMVVRRSPRELSFYEDRRWTERPEVYLRRALARALFEERGVVESFSGRGLTLDVELIAFEETEPPVRARLQALVVLRDDHRSLLELTITEERAVALGTQADPARATVDALSLALRAAVDRLVDRVVDKLAEPAARVAERTPGAAGSGAGSGGH